MVVVKPGWMMTYTGRIIYPLEFKAEDVCIEDIAHHLAHQCRYAGATKRHYSVAEHSVHVSKAAAWEDRAEALLHDASEAYLQDILSGMKKQEIMAPYRELEARVEQIIFDVFGVKSTPESAARIKAIDTRIVMDETKELLANPEPYWEARPGMQPLGVGIMGLSGQDAEVYFLRQFSRLFPEWKYQ